MTTASQQSPSYRVRMASWQQDCAALMRIRETVFIREQHVPEALEWDGEDEAAQHLLAETCSGEPIATARMLGDGHIGRVAVLQPWRGQGVGTSLMRRLLEAAQELGYRELFLDAQLPALPFYSRLGFCAEGDSFMDAGIAHRHMRLVLDR